MKPVKFIVALMALAVWAYGGMEVWAYGGSDYLLVIEGTKGEAKGKIVTLTEQKDGSFTATNLPSGTYKLIAKLKTADSPMKDALQMRRAPAKTTLAYECVVSPRDAASGQSSGKRQQNMMAIQKIVDDIPEKGVVLGTITIGDPDDSDNSPAAKGTPKHDTTKTKKPDWGGWDLKIAKKV